MDINNFRPEDQEQARQIARDLAREIIVNDSEDADRAFRTAQAKCQAIQRGYYYAGKQLGYLKYPS